MEHFLYSLLGILNAMSPYILLGFFVAGLLHAFIPASAMSRHLGGKGIKPVVKAALLGIPLPLCSCGVLPAAVALRRQGASKGASTSFLIATPQTGVDSIAATWSLLGLPFAIIRPIAALAGAVAGGWAVDRFDCDNETVNVMAETNTEHAHGGGFFHRLGQAVLYGFVDMVGSVGKWLVIGLVVAALITVFVPGELFAGLSRYPLLAMLAVVAVAIPMYVCATGSIPVALSLMAKGLSPGIAFVMLMAGPAANFASLVILGKTQGRRATAIYVASVAATAIAVGLVIDLLLPRGWFATAAMPLACHGHAGAWPLFPTVCSAVLVALLALAPVLGRLTGRAHRHHHHLETEINENDMETFTVKVEGMACPHCKKRVEEAAAAVKGTETATVDLSKATLTVTGTAGRAEVLKAVAMAGYNPVE